VGVRIPPSAPEPKKARFSGLFSFHRANLPTICPPADFEPSQRRTAHAVMFWSLKEFDSLADGGLGFRVLVDDSLQSLPITLNHRQAGIDRAMTVIMATPRRAEFSQIAQNANGLQFDESASSFLHDFQHFLMPAINRMLPRLYLLATVPTWRPRPQVVDGMLIELREADREIL